MQIAAYPYTDPNKLMPWAQVNDQYKARMHNMYAEFLSAVRVEFALHIRSSAQTLSQLRQEVLTSFSNTGNFLEGKMETGVEMTYTSVEMTATCGTPSRSVFPFLVCS